MRHARGSARQQRGKGGQGEGEGDGSGGEVITEGSEEGQEVGEEGFGSHIGSGEYSGGEEEDDLGELGHLSCRWVALFF